MCIPRLISISTLLVSLCFHRVVTRTRTIYFLLSGPHKRFSAHTTSMSRECFVRVERILAWNGAEPTFWLMRVVVRSTALALHKHISTACFQARVVSAEVPTVLSRSYRIYVRFSTAHAYSFGHCGSPCPLSRRVLTQGARRISYANLYGAINAPILHGSKNTKPFIS
jgi:hypothetical protein